MIGKTKKNIFFQLIYQILAIIIPLITTPIVTRALGADALGQYSYTYAVVGYFAIFALLGVNNYGTREVAKAKGFGSKKKLDEVFSEIYLLQVILSITVIALYYSFVLVFFTKYRQIALIQGIYLIGTLTDVAWFYFGIEEFKTTVTRNIVVKILCAAVIMLFIHEPKDLILYTATLIVSTAVSNIILTINLKKYVNFTFPSLAKAFSHFIPNFVLFIPVVAACFYVYIDKIMLGTISGTVQSGYYDVMEKIINVPNACIAAIVNVLFPRISALVAIDNKDNEKRIARYITLSMCSVNFFTVGCFFGLKAVAYLFVPLFLGEGFSAATEIVILGSAILIPRGIRTVVKLECLLPYERDKEVTISIISGATCDVIINLILIPRYGAYGAVIATFICEIVSCILMMFFARQNFNAFKYIVISSPFFIFAIIMNEAIGVLKANLLIDGIYALVMFIIVGGILYSLLSAIYLLYLKKKRIV